MYIYIGMYINQKFRTTLILHIYIYIYEEKLITR